MDTSGLHLMELDQIQHQAVLLMQELILKLQTHHAKLFLVLRNLADTRVDMEGTDSVNVANMIPGVRTDATAGNLTDNVITVSVLRQGTNPDATPWDGTFTDPIDGAQNLVYNDE